VALFFWVSLFPAHASFSSLYVFGDALSSTEDNLPKSSDYHGLRWSNGRVWVEVLAQRQGLPYDTNKNNSYFDHNSSNLVTQVKSSTIKYSSNDLVVVWVCNSDTFDNTIGFTTGSSNTIYAQWQAANNQAATNHFKIITNLYAQGVRTLILPNAVDISRVPAFNGSYDPSYSPFVEVMRAGCIDYNMKFSNIINQVVALYPALKIHAPNFFGLLNNVLTNAARYGLTNVTYAGVSIDAINAHNYNAAFPYAAINGYGTNFIFWDDKNPTAKFHAVIADEAQKLLPQVARISKITLQAGSNRLDVVDMPGGLNGFVEGATNLAPANWATNLAAFTSSNTTPSVFVPASGPQRFYRLRIPYYPYIWSWP